MRKHRRASYIFDVWLAGFRRWAACGADASEPEPVISAAREYHVVPREATGLRMVCMQGVVNYRWKKGFAPNNLHFFWVARLSDLTLFKVRAST